MLNRMARGIVVGFWAIVIGLLFAAAWYATDSGNYVIVPPAHSQSQVP